MSKASYHRPDIDGLRAVAILSVIVFHVSPSALQGGYLGVDIFFVISGYLITDILTTKLRNERFSFVSFYSSRMRRLFPTLFIVLAATWGISWFILLPSEFSALGRHMAAAAAFVSNFLLWTEAGYFDVAAEQKPLLHLWSLGVEEQFYLIWPVATVALLTATKRAAAAWIAVGCGASFVVSMVLLPDASFYLPHARAWELGIGALLVFLRIKVRGDISVIGLIAISAGLVFGTPGAWWSAPAVTSGAAALIASEGNITNKLLSSSTLVFFGRISYALYLWHWPLITLARMWSSVHAAGAIWPELTAIAISFVLATVTTFAIDIPLKKYDRDLTVAIISVFGIACLAAVGFLTVAKSGFAGVAWRAEPVNYLSKAPIIPENWRNCFLARYTGPDHFGQCVEPGDLPLVFVWGDSHADHLVPGILGLKDRHFRIAEYTASICPPIPYIDFSESPECKSINDFALAKIRALKPKVIIFAARWSLYSMTPESHIQYAVNVAKQFGHVPIILVGPAPDWKPSLEKIIQAEIIKNGSAPYMLTPSKPFSELETSLKNMAEKSGIYYASPTRVLCDSGECMTRIDNSLTAYDDSHFTAAASTFFAEKELSPLIKEAISASGANRMGYYPQQKNKNN